METLYTGHIHGFPASSSKGESIGSTSIWDEQSGLVALGVVLGSSVSLVGLAFAFITYSLFSDLRSLAGTALLSFLASLFMGQLFFVIGVGGIQDADLCLSLSMAQMYMKLASLAWLCCCCHHALTVFRTNTNLLPAPETNMGKSLAHYSGLSWGFPLLMVAVALAFKYSEGYDDYPLAHVDTLHATPSMSKKLSMDESVRVSRHNMSSPFAGSYAERHCWLMDGPAYLWSFLIPGSVLLLLGLWLAFQASDAVKFLASLQVDSRTRNKLLKRRGLQIGLFIKLLILLAFLLVLGATASLWSLPELWAVYSIIQGSQGILTAFLVTCNCRVLKLYTVPRHKQQHKYVAKNVDKEVDEEEVDIFSSHYSTIGSATAQHPLKEWPNDGGYSQIPKAGGSGSALSSDGTREKHSRGDTFLASDSECDKSFGFSGGVATDQEKGEVVVPGERILKPGVISGVDDEGESVVGSSSFGPGYKNKKSLSQTAATPPRNGKLSGALNISELQRKPLPSAV